AAKQAPHRPGTRRAQGPRARSGDVSIVPRSGSSRGCGGGTAMNSSMMRALKGAIAVLTVVLVARAAAPAHAQSPIAPRYEGVIDLSADGPAAFAVWGAAPHGGRFLCLGEVEFGPGPVPGTVVAEGVAVFAAGNGNVFAGVVAWEVGRVADGILGARMDFSPRAAVEFSDGTTVSSTGGLQGAQTADLVPQKLGGGVVIILLILKTIL